MIDAQYALKALEDARTAQAGLAERVNCPPHMRVAFGLIMGALIAAQAAPSSVAIGVTAACLGAVVLMIRAIRRRTGIFVNGYRRGRTRWVALGLLAIVESALAFSLWLKLAHHLVWAPLAAGAAVTVIAIAASFLWQAAYRADLSAEGGLMI